MLELIFQGLIEWIYGLILEAWEHFASSLLDLMSMDFAYLEEHIPIIPTIRQAILAIGWALLLGNLVFQAVKSMLSGLGFEGEDQNCCSQEPSYLPSFFWRVHRSATSV